MTLEDKEWLARQFESHRPRLKAVAYRLLGSLTEADDAIQGTWLRLSRANSSGIDNLGGWLTTAVARECLDMLRRRKALREESLEVRFPDPVVLDQRPDPEYQALVADSMGLALLVVLETLSPAERVAFVLHDVFAVPHDQIAHLLERSPAATRQLATRARRKLQGEVVTSDTGHRRQQEIVDAFLAASRQGDFHSLIALLDPAVVIRSDRGTLRAGGAVRGARAVAQEALRYAERFGRYARPVLVNGSPGLVAATSTEPVAILAFTVQKDRIVAIEILTDRRRLRALTSNQWSRRGTPLRR